MSAVWIGAVFFAAGLLAMYWLGYRVGARIKPDREEIRAYLDAQLSSEEFEAAERRTRAQMHRAGRTSLPNPTAGTPVRISSIQITR